MKKKKKLTIGMATFDDFEGVYFTIQSLRLNNLDRLDELDLVVIDNNPTSLEGKATATFCSKACVRYLEETSWRSTAVRDRIFREAEAPVAMSIDPHVLFEPGAVARLIDFFDERPDTPDLFHGVMLYDYLDDSAGVVSHMNPEWRENMFGTWGHDEKAQDPEADPYEIPMMGLGCFISRVDAWQGFHPLFKGFGGEEGYIHEKTRRAGAKTMILPWLRWIHRFDRPRGVVYPLDVEERITNYLIGWLELDKDPGEIIRHFAKTRPDILVDELILPRVSDLLADYEHDPEATIASWREEGEDEPVEEWNDTQVALGVPLEIDVKGLKLRVKKLGLEWAIES